MDPAHPCAPLALRLSRSRVGPSAAASEVRLASSAQADVKRETRMIASLSEAPLLAPDLPALWPGMLGRSARQAHHLPFGSCSALYFYFALNAIWHAVKLLGLEASDVLAPPNNPGVGMERLPPARP